MSEKNEKNENVNNNEAENSGVEIKGTDFVEPQGKGRKVIKWVLNGLALVASAVIGAVVGRAIGGKVDGNSDNSTETSEPNND